MQSYLSGIFQILRNMGLRYLVFRLGYELLRRSGLLRWWYPAHFRKRQYPAWEIWRSQTAVLFPFEVSNQDPSKLLPILQDRINKILSRHTCYFHGQWLKSEDWHTHPITGYRYNPNQHWTSIPDFSETAGDIKYIWEKSRFAFVYDLIRYQQYSGQDFSEKVFSEIEDWIDRNPVNRGPNWMCSQEIALRTFSWTFVLFYYRNSATLDQQRFEKISESLYRQFQHVASNHRFARLAVRNNHSITEALSLYLAGMLFPFFPESGYWKKVGKRRFENEISFQIQEDGTFIQHSMNYHRMVVQLLTWAIELAHLNGDQWNEVVYERARKSVLFLRSCQDEVTGWLPNYGNNDGTLVFPLTSCHFRDFRPQLNALATILGIDLEYGTGVWEEECAWLGIQNRKRGPDLPENIAADKLISNGYFVFKDSSTLTFIRNARYQYRPYQADNLHLDIWIDGENVLQDAGTYLYNTDSYWLNYFSGTSSHNTVKLGNYNQMKKGLRFTWFNWIKKSNSSFSLHNEAKDSDFIFVGEFEGFKELGKGIIHRRIVTKKSADLHWIVEDWIENLADDLPMNQLWHVSENFFANYKLKAFLHSGNELFPKKEIRWVSETYGQKKAIPKLVFTTKERYIRTELVKTNTRF